METAVATKTKWGIDATHSEVQFKVKHLVISMVTGSFKKFSGSVQSEEEDFDGASVSFSVDVNSVDTNQADRDKHLKSPDFFAAEQYPTLGFTGQLKRTSGNDYKLIGPLTIKGTTRPVELAVSFGGIMVDPYGNTKAGFEVNGKINRKDFGLTWSAVTETGGVVVSEEVKLQMNIQIVKG